MKLWAKILIILMAMIAALLAYFWLKPDITVEKTEGTASIDLIPKTEDITPKKEPLKETPSPELSGFSGLETELDALQGAM